jgi:hypothetical protein
LEIISNDERKADSGIKAENRLTSSQEQGNCMESVGNSSENTATGQETP